MKKYKDTSGINHNNNKTGKNAYKMILKVEIDKSKLLNKQIKDE